MRWVWVERLYSYIFFFSSRRRHTRWNCDWSSDVCSSDLVISGALNGEAVLKGRSMFATRLGEMVAGSHLSIVDDPTNPEAFGRSEERRVGKECRSRWSP